MTFDTSHALLAGKDEREIATFCREYAERIDHLHLVDTRGGDDEHLPVGMGRIDFATVLDELAAIGWSGTATLEIGTEDYDTIALGKNHVEALLADIWGIQEFVMEAIRLIRALCWTEVAGYTARRDVNFRSTELFVF